jgi:hypothetical protein
MSLKKRAEFWQAQAMLVDRPLALWKEAFVAVVFWLSPPGEVAR